MLGGVSGCCLLCSCESEESNWLLSCWFELELGVLSISWISNYPNILGRICEKQKFAVVGRRGTGTGFIIPVQCNWSRYVV